MSLKGLQKSMFLPSISGIDSWHFVKSVKKSTYHVTKLEKVRRLYHAFRKWFMSNWKGFKNFCENGIEYCHYKIKSTTFLLWKVNKNQFKCWSLLRPSSMLVIELESPSSYKNFKL